MNSSSISNGVVCYNETTEGSRAVYICDDGYNLMEGNEATRVCQSDGNWNGSIPKCIPGTQGVAVNFIHFVFIASTYLLVFFWHFCIIGVVGSCT